MAIEVPRDQKPKDEHVTKEIEEYLFDLFAAEPEVPYTKKELYSMVRRKFGGKWGDDLKPHVNWAANKLDFNKLIKKVAPGTYENIDGPDDEYMERETGYAPEGEFAGRSFDVRKDTSKPRNREDFKHEMFKSDFGVRTLKNLGKSREEVEAALLAANFNTVCLKLALKKHFEGAETGME